MTIEQTIQRLIDQDIYVNASTMVADLNDAEVWESLPNTYDNLLPALVADDYEQPVRDALQVITPAGAYDVCDALGYDVLLAELFGDADPDTVEAFNRKFMIDFLDSEETDWQEIADHLDLEPHTIEALQLWLVSDYLADALEEVNALVARDVLGFNVWGRTECGQSLTMDSDLRKVAELIERRLADMRA